MTIDAKPVEPDAYRVRMFEGITALAKPSQRAKKKKIIEHLEVLDLYEWDKSGKFRRLKLGDNDGDEAWVQVLGYNGEVFLEPLDTNPAASMQLPKVPPPEPETHMSVEELQQQIEVMKKLLEETKQEEDLGAKDRGRSRMSGSFTQKLDDFEGSERPPRLSAGQLYEVVYRTVAVRAAPSQQAPAIRCLYAGMKVMLFEWDQKKCGRWRRITVQKAVDVDLTEPSETLRPGFGFLGSVERLQPIKHRAREPVEEPALIEDVDGWVLTEHELFGTLLRACLPDGYAEDEQVNERPHEAAAAAGPEAHLSVADQAQTASEQEVTDAHVDGFQEDLHAMLEAEPSVQQGQNDGRPQKASAEDWDQLWTAMKPQTASQLPRAHAQQPPAGEVDSLEERKREKELLESVGTRDEPALIRAVRTGDYSLVRRLLLRFEKCNLRDRNTGETALFEAAATARPDMVALLLLVHADPRIKSKSGCMAMDMVSDSASKALLDLWHGNAELPHTLSQPGDLKAVHHKNAYWYRQYAWEACSKIKPDDAARIKTLFALKEPVASPMVEGPRPEPRPARVEKDQMKEILNCLDDSAVLAPRPAPMPPQTQPAERQPETQATHIPVEKPVPPSQAPSSCQPLEQPPVAQLSESVAAAVPAETQAAIPAEASSPEPKQAEQLEPPPPEPVQGTRYRVVSKKKVAVREFANSKSLKIHTLVPGEVIVMHEWDNTDTYRRVRVWVSAGEDQKVTERDGWVMIVSKEGPLMQEVVDEASDEDSEDDDAAG